VQNLLKKILLKMHPIKSVAILIPLFNEEKIIAPLLDRLHLVVQHLNLEVSILFIDDGSTDSTSQMIFTGIEGKKNYSAIFLSRNFGHQAAITAGLAELRNKYDAVFIMDGDLQDPPELIDRFIVEMDKGYDVVYGIRSNRKESFLKTAFYKIYYRVVAKFSNIHMPLDAGDFSLISKRIVAHLNSLPEESRYLRGLRSWVGFKQIGIQYDRDERFSGSSKYSYKKLFRLAFNGIFNFSELPIRAIGYMGGVLTGASAIYLGATLYKKLMYNTVPEGFTALIFAIVLFSGVQLLSLSIIGEYILRIFFQVKKRPLFIIERKIINGELHNE
jgi:dolichol-phosphate mannosyltransferase